MALDALEKEHFRRKLALRMGTFLGGTHTVSCVSGHYFDEPVDCELCLEKHADELLVIKNRGGKKMKLAAPCVREMVRFQVVDVEDLPRWLEKLKGLRLEGERRRTEVQKALDEARKRLEKKVIVRRRPAKPSI